MDTHSYTKDTYLKEELLHPTLTRVLWIVCMEIIQKWLSVLHEYYSVFIWELSDMVNAKVYPM